MARKRKGKNVASNLKKPRESAQLSENKHVYNTLPEQPKVKKTGQLSPAQLEEYFEKGFLVLPNFIDHELLDEVKKGVEDLVDDLAEKLFTAGKIKNKHEDKKLEERLIYIEKEYPGASVVLHKSDELPQSFRKLWGYDKLLNVIEQILGPEISGHPVWNLRPKTPHNEQMAIPWHQDNAYFMPECEKSLIASAWIPLLDVKRQNGCMQMVSGGHRKGITAEHTCCAGGTWYVDLAEEEMIKALDVDMANDVKTCEFSYGGLILFNNCIPHRSLENMSDSIRWSLDLRWHKTGENTGSFGEGVVMRTAKEPDMKIDWSKAAVSQRNKLQSENVGHVHSDLEPIISGPWMRRWKIVHHNKHTARSEESSAEDEKP